MYPSRRDKELSKVKLKPEDVELFVDQCMVEKKVVSWAIKAPMHRNADRCACAQAERKLREHGGDLKAALLEFVMKG